MKWEMLLAAAIIGIVMTVLTINYLEHIKETDGYKAYVKTREKMVAVSLYLFVAFSSVLIFVANVNTSVKIFVAVLAVLGIYLLLAIVLEVVVNFETGFSLFMALTAMLMTVLAAIAYCVHLGGC